MLLSPSDSAKLQAARDALSREDAPRCPKLYRPDSRYTDQDECAREAGHDGGCGPRQVLESTHLRNVLTILDHLLQTKHHPPAVVSRILRRVVVVHEHGTPRPRPQGPRVCNCGSTECRWVPNPYLADIEAVYAYQYLCDSCLDILRQEC